jgi:hypothetical protein
VNPVNPVESVKEGRWVIFDDFSGGNGFKPATVSFRGRMALGSWLWFPRLLRLVWPVRFAVWRSPGRLCMMGTA